MSLFPRMLQALAVGCICLFATSHPASVPSARSSYSTAQAQGSVALGRLDLYLPPPRVSPPPPLPPRPALPPARPVSPQWKWAIIRGPSMPEPPARPRSRPRPGLFTVSRIGHRLLYRKGYLGEVPVHLVVADLNDPEIKIGVIVAHGGIGTTESFAGMVARTRPAAALTGTFFGEDSGLPTGDLVVNGRAVYQGFVGTAVAFTEGNIVSFIPTGYKEKTAWSLYDGVMRAGPLLVQSGRIAVGPREEGFVSLSPAARRLRTAVGITPGHKLLLVAVKEPISLWWLAKLMRGVGAYHAVALDGGTSTGLYFRGQMIARPGRALTNALVIYAYQQRYRQAKESFFPGLRPRPAARPVRLPPLRIEVEPAPEASPPALLPAQVAPGDLTGSDAAASSPGSPTAATPGSSRRPTGPGADSADPSAAPDAFPADSEPSLPLRSGPE